MKEFKGTKGEWSYQSNTQTGVDMGYNILADEKDGWGKWIGEAKFPRLFDGTEEEAEANAKLIAAAPELLEACQAAIRLVDLWLPEYTNAIPEEHKVEILALGGLKQCFESAITKALGE